MINKAALLIVTTFTLGVALIIFVLHKPLADVFIDFSKPDAIQIYHLAMTMSVLTSWLITLPLAYIFGLYLKFGVIGIVVASGFTEIILVLSLWLRWKYTVRNVMLR